MKKLIALLLALVMVFALVACGEKASTDTTETPSVNDTTNDTTNDPAEAPEETPDAQPEDQPAAPAEGTAGEALLAAYKQEIANNTDIAAVADALAAAEIGGYSCMTQEFEAGYLPGFSEDVTGFTKCVGFMPMIGSIPYVAYIFEVEDAAGFLSMLEGIADPRWNICTQAEETVSDANGSYVFFAMLPGEDA